MVRTFVTSHRRVPTKCLLIRAPVGQAATHCPHIRQISRSMGRSKDVKSGRWQHYGPELLRFRDRNERECYPPGVILRISL